MTNNRALNNGIITESLLKKRLVHLTGRVQFKTIKRQSKQGLHLNKSKPKNYAYILAVEVKTPQSNSFKYIHTELNKIREFSSIESICNFLKKIESYNFEKLNGVFNFE